MNKKWLAIGSILLIFGVILYISGGGYRDAAEQARSDAFNNYREAMDRYHFDQAAHWKVVMNTLYENRDIDKNIISFLQITGGLMVLSSFFVLIAAVYKEEKIVDKNKKEKIGGSNEE